MTSNKLSPVKFTDLPGWEDDQHLLAFQAFLETAEYMQKKPYPVKKFDVDMKALQAISKIALDEVIDDEKHAKRFFERYFTPHKVSVEDNQRGFVTGYYEPEVRASRVKTKRFCYPLYRRPNDLIELNDDIRPETMDPSYQFGQKIGAEIHPYPDRSAINNGFLEHKELELVYLESYIEAFFIHIQGSARLLLNDNGNDVMRVNYAGKTGHPFTAIGRILLDWDELTQEEISMQSIKAWLIEHPEEAMDLMERNQSYIFFQEVLSIAPLKGPIGASNISLTPMRSLAVDKAWHTYGSPIWVSLDRPLYSEKRQFQKLMIAQDTGSAIVGEARGDLFIGSGAKAGLIAGRTKQMADFYLFLPNP